MTFLPSLTTSGASYFPSLHPLILLQWRYAFIKRKGPYSFVAPKLGVGMPGLIWLNTLVLESVWMLAFMHASAYVLLLFEFSLCGLIAIKEMILGDWGKKTIPQFIWWLEPPNNMQGYFMHLFWMVVWFKVKMSKQFSKTLLDAY